MFGKLLKYDLKYVLRFWWIAAISMLALSFFGGLGFSRIITDSPSTFDVLFGMLGMMLFQFSCIAFSLYTFIMLCVRYYKHFFSDEGYLTFTLPVKRSTLLNAKIANGVILSLLSLPLIFAALVLFLAPNFDFLSDFYLQIDFDRTPTIIYELELLLFMIIYLVFTQILTYMSITIGSVIAKKHKVLAAIGIMYVINVVFSVASSLLSIGGITFLGYASDMLSLSENSVLVLIGLILLLLCVITALAALIVYFITLHLLERKLNLE